MTPFSIAKIVSVAKIAVPALALVGAGGAAVVFGPQYLQHEDRLETGTVSPATTPPPAPAVRSESPPALAAAETKVAALSAELAAPPPAPATDPSVPAFDLARIEGTGDAVIAGRAAPGATVELLRNGDRLDQAVADASGQFVMVPPRLPAGSYELTLRAKLADGTLVSSKQGVPVTVKEAEASSGAAQARAETVPQAAPQPQPPAPVAKEQSVAASQPSLTMAAGSPSDVRATLSEATPKSMTKVVVRGDSLWRISRVTYGAGEQYAIVYRANRDRIRNPNIIHPGQVLVLPVGRH